LKTPAWNAAFGLGLGTSGVELLRRQAEPSRVAADLVQRYQPIEAVEGRIFHAFCHYRTGELLKAHDQLALKLAAHPQQKEIKAEAEQRHRR
jgi:hypothetical protein